MPKSSYPNTKLVNTALVLFLMLAVFSFLTFLGQTVTLIALQGFVVGGLTSELFAPSMVFFLWFVTFFVMTIWLMKNRQKLNLEQSDFKLLCLLSLVVPFLSFLGFLTSDSAVYWLSVIVGIFLPLLLIKRQRRVGQFLSLMIFIASGLSGLTSMKELYCKRFLATSPPQVVVPTEEQVSDPSWEGSTNVYRCHRTFSYTSALRDVFIQ